MATERIDSIIDIPAVQAEYEKLNQYLNDLVASMEKVANSKIGAASQAQGIAATQAAVADLTQSTAQLAGQQEKLVNQAQTIVNTAKQQIATNSQIAASVKQYSGSIEENIRLQIQFTKQLSDNKNMQKELQAAFEGGKIRATAFGQSQIVLQKQQLELKSTISGLNSTLKQQTQENQAAGTSYKELSAQLTQLRTAYRSLSEAERASEGGSGLKAQITQLDQALKSIDGEMGIHVRHVGNYTGALKTLEAGLTEAQAQLQRFTEAGQQNTSQYQQAQAEVDLFTQLLAQQEKGFSSVTMEVRAVERALATMVQTGMEDTQMFRELQQELAKAQRKLHDFKQDQALLKSDLPGLSALTTVAKGLAGAYALGAGAAALLADGNEKVEKELNKLVAVMTVLQGLNEIHELVERKGAIATIASGVAAGFKNFILTGSSKIQKEATAATAENTAVEEGNSIAIEADVAAKETQVAANEAVTVSTTAATVASSAFRVALLATGIGAFLLLISTAAQAMGQYKEETVKSAKESAEFAESMAKLNEILMEQIRLSDESYTATKRYLENALDLAEKNKQSAYDLFAIKKNIADLEQKESENNLKRAAGNNDVAKAYQAINEQVESLKGRYDQLLTKQSELQDITEIYQKNADNVSQAYFEIYQKYHTNILEGDLKEQKEYADKEAAATKKLLEDKKKLLDAYNQANIKQVGHQVEVAQFSEAELRALALQSAKLAAAARIDANNRILGNEQTTQALRVAAMKDNLKQELAIIEAEKVAKLGDPSKGIKGDPSLTPAQRQQAAREAGAAEKKETAKTREDIRKLNLDYWKRDFAAYMEIQRGALELSASNNSQIADDQDETLDRRLLAYQGYEADQKRLLDNELFTKLSTEVLTDKQVEAAQADHQNKLNELARAGIEKRKGFQKETVETVNSKAQSELSQNYNADVSALAESLVRKRITQEQYTQQKKKLDDQYAIDSLRVEMELTRALIAAATAGTQTRFNLEKTLAEQNAQLAERQAKQAEDLAQKRIKSIEKVLKYEQEGAKIVQSIVDDGFTRRLNNIQKEQDANTLAKDKEITGINNSSLSAQDKAAKLIQIEAQAKVTQDRLDKEKRDTQLRQAKFDRDAQVLEIIGHGLVAAWKAGWPAGIAIEAESLIQAALLAAKPLPRFEKGTDSSPAGWAWTDEKGPELYRRPSGEVFLGNSRPTLRYLEAGTEITAHDQIDKVLYNQMIRGTANLIMPAKNNETAKEIRGLRSDLQAQTDRLEKAYQQAKRPIVIIQKPDLKSRYIP